MQEAATTMGLAASAMTFYGVEGRFLIDLQEEDRTVELAPKQGFTVPRRVVHRTRAPERTVILMIEGAGVVPTGD